jgi:hypothetical protein
MKAEQQVGTQLNRQNSSNPSTEAYRLADKIAEIEILDDGENFTLKESHRSSWGIVSIQKLLQDAGRLHP